MLIHVREEINKMTDRCQNFPRLRKRQRETEREIESSVSAIRQGLFQHEQDTTNILELITDIVYCDTSA